MRGGFGEADKKKDEDHEATFVSYGEVYVNDKGVEAMIKTKTPTYTVGTIIIREKLPFILEKDKEEKDKDKPELLTVMVKREKGFNPENGDWEFLVIEGDKSKIRQREKTGSCVQCHSHQKANDFVFRSYLSEDVRSKLK